ncbi:MAG: C10 family peptidase [Candidatus Kapabacteria bacterium]|nr:C10 family peptidase [Ignavibacteriota bacterium]MCW5884499.1 C10 family peptidase [Candidatus Kapabacteria bacterium]
MKKYIYIIVIIVGFLIILEMIARYLTSPNIIEVPESRSYLLNTSWNQIEEYSKYVEYDQDAGCWGVAIAQIAHYHKLNPRGNISYLTSNGDSIRVNLNDFDFQHHKFVSSINENTSNESKYQVAKYIYYIASLIYTNYGSSGYIETETMMDRIEKHLGFSVNFYEYSKEDFLSAKTEIKRLITEEIDNKRPLMFYFDNGDDFGHAVVIDGYTNVDNLFLVHLNQGLGGKHNGWYNPFKKIYGLRNDLTNRFLISFKPTFDN